jgi:hypothetical protein
MARGTLGLAPLIRTKTAAALARCRSGLFSEGWAVSIIQQPIESLLTTQTIAPDAWIEKPGREGFIADPFPWPGRPGTFLCEVYERRAGIGHLAVMEASPDRLESEVVLELGLDCHLSYPSTWSENGRVLCLPEMSAERRQVLYELTAGARARMLCVVSSGIAVADPTLFRLGDFYWIAYTDADIGLHDNLCLMYAEQIEGPWFQHRANPVKFDIRSSRPGGTVFYNDGRVFRPAQDCSSSYGSRLVVNEVRVCTPSDYEETAVAVLSPDPSGRFPDGLHTLSVGPDAVLIDGKRVMFDPGDIARRMQRRTERLIRRMLTQRRRRGSAAPTPVSSSRQFARTPSAAWPGETRRDDVLATKD